MKIRGKVIDDALIAQVRSEFYRPRSGRRIHGSFEDYLYLFCDYSKSVKNIAEVIGTSHQAISRLYSKYFSRLFPDRPNGRRKGKYSFFRELSSKRKSRLFQPKFFTNRRA